MGGDLSKIFGTGLFALRNDWGARQQCKGRRTDFWSKIYDPSLGFYRFKALGNIASITRRPL